jgi:hypothetical protein
VHARPCVELEEFVAAVPDTIEAAAREQLARVLPNGPTAAELDLDTELVAGYGLTSLNKVLFLMTLCDTTGVDLTNFTEIDVAQMHTLGDVVRSFAAHAETAA